MEKDKQQTSLQQSKEGQYIRVEFNGTCKTILREKLPEARQMEAKMQEAAHRAGLSQREIEEMYTLRIHNSAGHGD